MYLRSLKKPLFFAAPSARQKTQQLQARDSELAALKNQLKNAQDKVLQLTSDNVNLVQKLSKFVKEEQNEANHFVPEKCSSYKEIFET